MKTKFLILSLVVIALTGCINFNGNSRENIGIKYEIYSDKPSSKDGDLEFKFFSLREYHFSTNYNIELSLELVNRNVKATTFTVEKPKIIRESNGAEYSVGGYVVSQLNLECDIKRTISFSATLPISIWDETYSFNLKYGSKEVIYHLYETPDELRTKINVKFVVDNELVETKQIPEGRTINHSWVSSDYIYGCNDWYLDMDCITQLPVNYNILRETTVYGKKQSILQYNFPTILGYSFVNGYNFIPTSGEIVVPKVYEDKPVNSILSGSFHRACSGLKTIYIPKTVKIYSQNNFSLCTDLEYVYFEGAEDEWSRMNEATYPEKTQIVFNTYK